MPQREQIIAWLADAYAMEQSLANVLLQHCKDAAELPELHDRLDRHYEETRQHAERVRACLELLGTTPSTMKTMAGGLFGTLQGMSTRVFRDELVKNAISDYAMEHFEMACYSALAAAADEAGFTEIAQTCRDIFGEEAEMADWLEEQIPEFTRLHLQSTMAAR